MNRLAYTAFAIIVFLSLPVSVVTAQAQSCSAEDFGSVVDDTARALRELNADGAMRYNAKLAEFQEKYNLSQDEIRERAAALQDDRVVEFNREIEQLVNQMDDLSLTPANQIDCGKLEQLKQVRDRLLTVMGQKSGYMLANADVALDKPPEKNSGVQRQAKTDRETVDIMPPRTAGPVEAAPEQEPSYKPEQSQNEQVTALAPAPAADTPGTEAPAAILDPGLPERRPKSIEEASEDVPAFQEPTVESAPESENSVMANAEPQDLQPPTEFDASASSSPDDESETFSIDEIRDAGRGVFGTITAEFAGAINYAFQQFGRPNAFITGSEGGAALLAGLRYGKGDLHLKNGQISQIYWQGPSLGYDVGAEGSSTLFLVYNLTEQDRIYGRFTGIGGSAYVAGGFGLNVLGKSGMVMVPIRTGIGLRIGANLAYLKFTERQTWNPF